jgi:CheY-like chemotaxis protein
MPTSLEGKHFLIVDDEELICMIVEDMLTDLGCTATSCHNVEGALDYLQAERFDGALLDVNLAGAKCYPVAEALTERGTPFLLFTGALPGADEQRYNVRRLAKPFTSAGFVSAISELAASC